MAIKITDLIAPTLQASDSSIEFKSQWAFWKGLSKDSWDHLDIWWEIYRPGYKEAGKKPWDLKHYGVGGSSTSDSCTFLRNDPRASWKIYPIGSWQIGRVNVWIKGKTDKDKDASGWYYSRDLVIREPHYPEIEVSIEQGDDEWVEWGDDGFWSDQDMAIMVRKGKYDSAHMNAETDNYDTVVKIEKTSNASPTRILQNWKSYTEDEVKIPIDSGDIDRGLKYDEWVAITTWAYSRGCAGDSDTIAMRYVLAWPAIPQITNIAIDNSNKIVLIGINTRHDTYHPVDNVKLQRLKDSECETASAAENATGWTDVPDMVDGCDCKGLSDNLVDARPAKGKRTWYRVVAKRNEYVTYSVPVDSGLYQPAVEAQAGAASIKNAISGDDGESVVLDVAWDDDTFLNVTDPSEIANYKGSTQVTWASTEYAWQSTQNVNEFDLEWEDDEPRFEDFDHSAKVYVGGLTEGEDVFLRVRRTLANDSDTVYGPWSEIVAVKPVTSPAWVELTAPSYIARGESLPLSWTYGSEAVQTGWSIIDDAGKIWAHGEDSDGYCVISADELADVSELSLYVTLTTGGEWKRSIGAVKVRIVEAPTCAVRASSNVTALPIEIEGQSEASVITYYLTSRGITYETPEGQQIQYANDIVWSGQAQPGTLSINDAPLVNGCTYDFRAQAVNEETGLYSDVVSATFKVEWDRRAPAPDATLDVDTEALSVTITTIKTKEMVDGDTYEIYRMTKDGIYLIAEDIEPGSTVTDRFAPYSVEGSAYRLAVRTADGDCMWADYPYTLGHNALRLDWEDSFVELNYDIAISEGISKSFEAREHLDGTINGYWDKAVSHQASFSTNIIRFDSLETQQLLREVARFAGAVFVRTGSGLAFDANVNIDGIEESCTQGAIGVSLSVEEIKLTPDHACALSDIVKPDELASKEEEVQGV